MIRPYLRDLLHRAGRRVPDDVAVVGFGDSELAAYTQPPLTTVRQPLVDLGRQLARQLLRRTGGEEIEQRVLLPTGLVVRQSA